MNYKFYHLQPYKGRDTRHTCPYCGKPRCFTYYVDENGNVVGDKYGRCDHQTSCGADVKPPQNKREWKPRPMKPTPPKPTKPTKPDYIPFDLVKRSENLNGVMGTPLMRYLSGFFHTYEIEAAVRAYHIGCTKRGEVIFPQIDGLGNCRTGKVMAYGEDGHRIKGEIDRIDWLHSRWMKQQGKQSSGFNLKQCLFGEHLLTIMSNRAKTVAVVESEKTALICSIHHPEFVWVATGGKQGLSSDRCKALLSRTVVLFPDVDATKDWEVKAKAITYCRSLRVSDWARDEAPDSKRDIADLVLIKRQEAAREAEPQTVGELLKEMVSAGYGGEQMRKIVFHY